MLWRKRSRANTGERERERETGISKIDKKPQNSTRFLIPSLDPPSLLPRKTERAGLIDLGSLRCDEREVNHLSLTLCVPANCELEISSGKMEREKESERER